MQHPDRYYNSAAERVAAQASVTSGETAGERDTGSVYLRTDSGWVQVAAAGAAHAKITSDYRGIYPAAYYTSTAATLAAGASGRTLYESTDLTNRNQHILDVSALPGTTPVLKCYPTLDGATYSATPLVLINLATGALIAGATGITAVGIYAVAGPVGGGLKVKGIKWVLTGGAADVGATTIAAHGLV